MRKVKIFNIVLIVFILILFIAHIISIRQFDNKILNINNEDIVEITISNRLFNDKMSFRIGLPETDGFLITKNDDNSITYKASKTDYDKYMKSLKNVIIDGTQSINIESNENIKDFIYNEDFTKIVLIINKENYHNPKNYKVVKHIIPLSIHYQLFSKIDENDIKVTLVFKDAETGNIIDSFVYPNDY